MIIIFFLFVYKMLFSIDTPVTDYCSPSLTLIVTPSLGHQSFILRLPLCFIGPLPDGARHFFLPGILFGAKIQRL